MAWRYKDVTRTRKCNLSERHDGSQAVRLSSLQIAVQHVFEQFLTTGDVRGHFTLLEHVGLEFFELRLAAFDVRADAAVPRGVALLDEVAERAVLSHRGGNLQAVRERVHAADVRVEQIHRLE